MKIGVIGCGYVFDHYMTTLAKHPHLDIAGVADRDMARAPKVSDSVSYTHLTLPTSFRVYFSVRSTCFTIVYEPERSPTL